MTVTLCMAVTLLVAVILCMADSLQKLQVLEAYVAFVTLDMAPS
jgi:hypothetical protein